MAMVKLVPAGNYGVVETNHLESVKTGAVVAQYDLDDTDFASIPAENGMLLMVDHVTRKVKLPTGITSDVYLHASVEKSYDGKGRKYFKVDKGGLLPKLNKLIPGVDIFETNAVRYDNTTYATVAALTAAINSTTVYGIPSTTGYIDIVATLGGTEKVALKAVAVVTLPNGQTGIKFAVVKA